MADLAGEVASAGLDVPVKAGRRRMLVRMTTAFVVAMLVLGRLPRPARDEGPSVGVLLPAALTVGSVMAVTTYLVVTRDLRLPSRAGLHGAGFCVLLALAKFLLEPLGVLGIVRASSEGDHEAISGFFGFVCLVQLTALTFLAVLAALALAPLGYFTGADDVASAGHLMEEIAFAGVFGLFAALVAFAIALSMTFAVIEQIFDVRYRVRPELAPRRRPWGLALLAAPLLMIVIDPVPGWAWVLGLLVPYPHASALSVVAGLTVLTVAGAAIMVWRVLAAAALRADVTDADGPATTRWVIVGFVVMFAVLSVVWAMQVPAGLPFPIAQY